MDNEVLLTAITCTTQIILAVIGLQVHRNVRGMRRQQTAHNVYLDLLGAKLENFIPDLPTMRQAQEIAGVPRHARH